MAVFVFRIFTDAVEEWRRWVQRYGFSSQWPASPACDDATWRRQPSQLVASCHVLRLETGARMPDMRQHARRTLELWEMSLQRHECAQCFCKFLELQVAQCEALGIEARLAQKPLVPTPCRILYVYSILFSTDMHLYLERGKPTEYVKEMSIYNKNQKN